MPTPTLPSTPATPWHLSLYYHRHGTAAGQCLGLESQLILYAAMLGADVAYCGPGGAPYFQRWRVVSAPSEAAQAQMGAVAVVLGNAYAGRLPLVQPITKHAPLVALPMTEAEFQLCMLDPAVFGPDLECDQVGVE